MVKEEEVFQDLDRVEDTVVSGLSSSFIYFFYTFEHETTENIFGGVVPDQEWRLNSGGHNGSKVQ